MSSSKITSNATANIIGMAVQIIIAFILSPYLVSMLGDTKYGIWTIAIAFTGYMNLMDIGLTSAVNKYVAEYNSLNQIKKVETIISTALALFLVMGFVIVAVSPYMADFVVDLVNIDPDLVNVVHLLIIIVSFDIAIFVIGGLYKGAFGGLQSYWIINYTQIISSLYKAGMFYWVLSDGYDLLAMGLVSITANLLSFLIFYYLFKKKFSKFSIDFNLVSKKSSSKILNYSKFTFLAMLANQIIYYSDAFVIGYFLGAAAVTYYSIPWTLAEYTKKISLVISQTFTPAISEFDAKGDMDTVKALYISGTKYMVFISNLLSVGIFVLGGAFIALWMGPKYKELCETVLIILFVNQFVMGPQQISYSVLQGLGKQKMYSYMSFAVSILNLVLSIILVQEYGIEGVAIGAVLPQVVFYGLFVPWLTLKKLDLSKWEYFKGAYLGSFIPTIILFIVLFYINLNFKIDNYIVLLSSALLATLLYGLSLYYFSFSKKEQEKFIKFNIKLLNKVK